MDHVRKQKKGRVMKNEVVTCSYRDKENEASRSCVSHFWERQNGRIILWNKQIVCIVKKYIIII
jgi:hypothetical protein